MTSSTLPRTISFLLPILCVACAPVVEDDFSGTGDVLALPGTWDVSPPSVVEGTLLHSKIECDLLDGISETTWVKENDVWVVDSYTGGEPYDEVFACMTECEGYLDWADDGSIYILGGGLHHDLVPSGEEGTWAGEVYPMETTSDACESALDQIGLTIPARMTFEFVGLE